MDENALEGGRLLMEHIDRHQLKAYIDNELDIDKVEQAENHMYACEACMRTYISLLDQYHVQDSVSEGFTDKVIDKVDKQIPVQKYNLQQKRSSKTMSHYLLAAGLTILIMLTGAFQEIITMTHDQAAMERTSLTEQLMHKTNHLLDKIKGGQDE